MYKDIANFLKESPEWIESWLNTPVKVKYVQNPLMIPEIMANILNYIPLRYCKGVCKLWNREIDFALKDLYRKQELLVKKYWDLVLERKKVSDELNTAYDKFGVTNPSYTNALYKKFMDLCDQKEKAFSDQVKVEEHILFTGLADKDEVKKINRHIMCLADGFDPVEVGWTETNEMVYHWDDEEEFDYWGDEDPDVSDEDSDV